MSKFFIGIDVGKKGGIVVLDHSGKIVKMDVMPIGADDELCPESLLDMISPYSEECHCILERLHAMPLFGAKGNFNFGGQYFTVKTIMKLTKTPYTEVLARIWQKELFQGIPSIEKSDGKLDTKKMALVSAQRLFPGANFLATSRSKKDHEGIVDALLIAEYGRRNFK